MVWYRLRRFPTVHWSAHSSYFLAAKTAYGGKQYWVHRVMFDRRGSDTPLLHIGPISSYFTVDVITRLAEESDKYSFQHEPTAFRPRMATSADLPWIRALLSSKPVLVKEALLASTARVGPKPHAKKDFVALMGYVLF